EGLAAAFGDPKDVLFRGPGLVPVDVRVTREDAARLLARARERDRRRRSLRETHDGAVRDRAVRPIYRLGVDEEVGGVALALGDRYGRAARFVHAPDGAALRIGCEVHVLIVDR